MLSLDSSSSMHATCNSNSHCIQHSLLHVDGISCMFVPNQHCFKEQY